MRSFFVLLSLLATSTKLMAETPKCLNLESLIKENFKVSPPRIKLVDFEWTGGEPEDLSWIFPLKALVLAPVDSETAVMFHTNGIAQFGDEKLLLGDFYTKKILECSEAELTFGIEGTEMYIQSVVTVAENSARLAEVMAGPHRGKNSRTAPEPSWKKRNKASLAQFYSDSLDRAPFSSFDNLPPETVGKGSAMRNFLNRELEFRAELHKLRLQKAKERAELIRKKHSQIRTTFSLQPDGSLKVTTTGFFGPGEIEDQVLVTKVAVVSWGDREVADQKSLSLLDLEQMFVSP